MTIKQIIVVREDLNMSRGKIGSQCAHASMGVILAEMDKRGPSWSLDIDSDSELKEWIENSFIKIVVSVKSEKKLLDLYQKVKDAGLRTCLITDNGTTEFAGVPTNTCIAIGPHSSETLDPFTKKYPLLK